MRIHHHLSLVAGHICWRDKSTVDCRNPVSLHHSCKRCLTAGSTPAACTHSKITLWHLRKNAQRRTACNVVALGSAIFFWSPYLDQGWHENPAANHEVFGDFSWSWAMVLFSLMSPKTMSWYPCLSWKQQKGSDMSFLALIVMPTALIPSLIQPIPEHVSTRWKWSSHVMTGWPNT